MSQASNLDPETSQVMSDGEKIANLVASDGWGLVRQMLMEEIAQVNSITDIVETDPQKIIMEVGVRQQLAKILLDWVRKVEGQAEQFKNNGSVLLERKDFVIRISEAQ